MKLRHGFYQTGGRKGKISARFTDIELATLLILLNEEKVLALL
jgi:hypothetical protein